MRPAGASVIPLALAHYRSEEREREEADQIGVPFTYLEYDNDVTGRHAFRCATLQQLAAVLKGLTSEAAVVVALHDENYVSTLAKRLTTVLPRRPFEAALRQATDGEVL